MGTIDDPVTDEEYAALWKMLVPVRAELARRFGSSRAQAIFRAYCISVVAGDLTHGRREYERTLTTLNEALRTEQLGDYTESDGDEADFRPWVLVPVQEP
jgi:hypothetical protein